jgi:hypothetical protein
MTVVIDENLTKKETEKLLKQVKPTLKILDAKKFLGKIKIKGDPLKIQRQLRNE